MIARFAGTTLTGEPATAPGGGGRATVVFLKAGMNLETGSARPIFPSSTSIITATLVKAFVWDAMRKIVSFFIGRPGLDVGLAEGLEVDHAAVAGDVGHDAGDPALRPRTAASPRAGAAGARTRGRPTRA